MQMPTPREHFDSWFVNVLESLYEARDAGFVIMMTIFPLLERYLRQRSGIPGENDRLTDKFFDELRGIFPALGDADQARAFWQVYRNGLLHQGTFSQQVTLYYGVASHDIPETILIDKTAGNFVVHPVRFAKQVLEQIGNDFSTYEGATSAAPLLATVGNFKLRQKRR
jgi:hypothetical protein